MVRSRPMLSIIVFLLFDLLTPQVTFPTDRVSVDINKVTKLKITNLLVLTIIQVWYSTLIS